jgi:transcriptional regulator with XRE-family HTH domain
MNRGEATEHEYFFSCLDPSYGLTQAEVAERMGTTQSAVARLESANAKHSPSVATLRRYAEALGHRVEVRLVKA